MTADEQAEFDKIKKAVEDAQKERDEMDALRKKEQEEMAALRSEFDKVKKERDEANAIIREQDTTPKEELLKFDVIFNGKKEGSDK